jgi:acyl-CoA reductase-like NAD-dependent aldehyde dehydrogenase
MKACNLIDGHWDQSAPAGGVCVDPASGEPVAEFVDATEAAGRLAVQAARAAFERPGWAHMPRLRADVLLAFANNLEQRAPEIASWIVRTSGKLAGGAAHEVAASVSELRYYAGLARNLWGRVAELDQDCYSMIVREPIGVAAIIVPWNAPATLLIRSLGPVLAAGCTAVIKSAHQTSVVNQLVLACLTDVSQLPHGVVNTLTESGSAVGRAWCADPDIDAISFTGSSATGKRIAEASAGTLKRLSLELGGKAPAIVLEDCDLNVAIPQITSGAMALSGQMCTAISRVLIHESKFEQACKQLATHLGNLRLGPGTDRTSQLGPLIDVANRDRVLSLIEAGNKVGRFHLRGGVPTHLPKKAAFLSPSLLEVADTSSPYIQDELFGPFVVAEIFRSNEEAIERSNATRYGLAASVWTANQRTAHHIARRLKSGTVWINAHNKLFAEAETGGYRESGYGRLHGVEGLNDFMESKHVYFEA